LLDSLLQEGDPAHQLTVPRPILQHDHPVACGGLPSHTAAAGRS